MRGGKNGADRLASSEEPLAPNSDVIITLILITGSYNRRKLDNIHEKIVFCNKIG